MKSPKKTFIVQRVKTYRYLGVKDAAYGLGVSPQAVSNFLTGANPSALSKDKQEQIKIVNTNN